MNLLYPKGKECVRELPADTYKHLAIDEIINQIAVTAEEKKLVGDVFHILPNDIDTTIFRQEILADFLADESLCEELADIIGKLDVLKEFSRNSRFTIQKKANLWELINYMEEMEIYSQVIESLNQAFENHEVHAKGLLEIASLLKDVVDEDRIEELKEIIKSLRADMSTLRSVTVGINLNTELYPEEVVILGYGTEPFYSKFMKTAWGLSILSQRKITYREPSQFMKYICDDMERHLSKNVQKTKTELKSYINLKGYFLLDICDDLKYYLLMAKFARKLMEGDYSISMPKIVEGAEEVCMKDFYNIRLADNTTEIVKNDFTFSEKEKLFILTGPNRGGKTMITQAIGLNAVFAAQGLFVAAKEYEGYLFDNVLTHFPADENETLDFGRLGEEAVRVQNIVKVATPKTLVLLNETYSSTSAMDGVYMASDLVHVLKHKNVPMIFNTHLHELAYKIEEMNQWEGNSDVVSITMEIKDNVNTFKVLRKVPEKNSYARNVALKYGVTYEQMIYHGDYGWTLN